jgi:hypothetical protein
LSSLEPSCSSPRLASEDIAFGADLDVGLHIERKQIENFINDLDQRPQRDP